MDMQEAWFDLDDLIKHQHPRNPKEHDVGAIITSYHAFGFLERIVRNNVTGYVLGGHGRIAALESMRRAGDAPPDGVRVVRGHWMVQGDWVNISSAQEIAALIALNRTTELGGWDRERLGQELLTIIQQQDGLPLAEASGFDAEDLADLADDELTFTLNTCPKCGYKW